MTAVLETRGLSKRFGNKSALSSFDLRVERGGIHALIGSNGAGKSTLFRLLLGFLTPSAGESFLLGENSLQLSPQWRSRVGYVNEEHTLPRWLKASELKAMQRSYYPQWNEEVYRNVIANFDVDPQQKVGSLSRGERAGFNLAMALAQSPELLILDEPTLGLDVVARQEFLDAVLFCTQTDTTVIYCSHQMEEVERLADELIILEKGKLRLQATPADFSMRVQAWIVDATFSALVREKVPNLLSGRRIEDSYHFFVLDAGDSFGSQLALLGIRDSSSAPVGLSTAVRALLAQHHLGNTGTNG
jgi:ABC-2 type transport system ATP-binding protein